MEDVEEDARRAQLTAEMAWLRRLARALLHSDEGADLAHDTWLLARDHIPADGRPLRPWLGRVARNLAITRARGRQRREVRERESASLVEPEARPDELVQRVELQKLVATEVLGLAEPYRSTVLLHYFEELTCAEMARRLKLPEGTVRRRLKVALDELRARLDRRTCTSGAGAGLAALAPLAGATAAPRPGGGAAAVGVVAMKKIVIAVLVLLVLLASAVHWHRRHRLASRAGQQQPPTIATSRPGAVATSRLAGAGMPSWMASARAGARHVAGHVLVGNARLAGARVKLGFGIADDPSALLVATVTTGSDGSFDFGPRPGLRFSVSADAPGYVARAITLQAGDPDTDPSRIVLRLGECHARMSGRITDSSGAGIANALVATAGFSGARSGEQGNYQLCAPSGSVAIRIAAPGYGTREVSVRVYGDLHRDFTLVPEAIIAGVVVDRANHPVAGALVTALPDASEFRETTEVSLIADSQGRFQLDGLAPGKYDLMATADGLGADAPVPVLATPARPARDVRVVGSFVTITVLRAGSSLTVRLGMR